MKTVICPSCEKEGNKVICIGLPMKFCRHCCTLWGFFSGFYAWFISPIEVALNGGFSMMIYEGSYWAALYEYLFGGDE